MAFYVGETGRIWGVVLDYDGEVPLTNADVDGFITIYDASGTEIQAEAGMSYTTTQRPLMPGETSSSGDGYWYYDWDTSALEDEAAKFRARVRFEGGGRSAHEYLLFRVSANPV